MRLKIEIIDGQPDLKKEQELQTVTVTVHYKIVARKGVSIQMIQTTTFETLLQDVAKKIQEEMTGLASQYRRNYYVEVTNIQVINKKKQAISFDATQIPKRFEESPF